MLIKMRESKGFTLVELMIVVAIIGILAAVAVPYYQRYVAKSRLTSLVFPGVHAIENAISTRFAVAGSLPVTIGAEVFGDADTTYFGTPTWTRSGANTGSLAFTVKTNTTDKKFAALEGKNTFSAVAEGSAGKLYWRYDGTLAKEFGL